MAKDDRLKQRLAAAMESANKLSLELDQVRNAARQLMAGLMEYSKEENWTHDDETVWIWSGEGNGPEVARKFLGLLEEEKGTEVDAMRGQ